MLAQTYPNIELIIVNDGSTDRTSEILNSYGGRIKEIRQTNKGPSAARNLGAKAASGHTLSFLDSDDTWHPTKIERQMSVLDQVDDSVPCCICNSTLDSDTGKRITSFDSAGIDPKFESGLILNPCQLLATRFILFNQVVTVRRSAFEKVGGFNEDLWLLEDHDLALKLSLLGPWGFVRMPLVSKYESVGNLGGIARQDQIHHLSSVKLVLDGFLSQPEIPESLRAQISAERKRLISAIKARRLSLSTSPAVAFAGKSWIAAQRMHSAVRRRSPCWPKARIHCLDASPLT